jgi:hypothetical protein
MSADRAIHERRTSAPRPAPRGAWAVEMGRLTSVSSRVNHRTFPVDAHALYAIRSQR